MNCRDTLKRSPCALTSVETPGGQCPYSTGLLPIRFVQELRFSDALALHAQYRAPPRVCQHARGQVEHLACAVINGADRLALCIDLNVNGPLEKLLNLGLDSRLSFQ